jgi:hypothetical protein
MTGRGPASVVRRDGEQVAFGDLALIVTFETTAWSDTRDRIRHRPDEPPPTGEIP